MELHYYYILYSEMEDYVIIDSVLQAIHMSKYKQKPKHVKKYELSSCKSSRIPRDNYTICYELPCKQTNGQLRQSQLKRFKNQYGISQKQSNENNKVKTKFILKDCQKLCFDQDSACEEIKHVNQEFFTKRVIEPKKDRSQTSRSSRTATLFKTPQIMKGLFYDVNIELIRKKSRKCIIMPQRKIINEQKVAENKQNSKKPTIRELIKQEIRQQQRRRKAECKTSGSQARHKNQIQRQARRAEESIRNKENQQKQLIRQAFSDRQKLSRKLYNQQFNESILPLSKQEMKAKTSVIMHKYGVDSGKCCYKFLV